MMISNGEKLDVLQRQRFLSIMTGDQFYFDVGNSHRQFYWGYSLISAGEVITDDEKKDELISIFA